MTAGAVIGAVTGAGVGAFTAYVMTGGDLRETISGALGGAFTGAVTGVIAGGLITVGAAGSLTYLPGCSEFLVGFDSVINAPIAPTALGAFGSAFFGHPEPAEGNQKPRSK